MKLYVIAELPGRKVIIKGNHDYWWSSIKKLRGEASENMYYIQNDIIELGNLVISGTRLWNYPFIKWHSIASRNLVEVTEENGENDKKREFDHEKIRNREMERLERCLSKMQNSDGKLRILMTHFPPVGANFEANEISRRLSENKIDVCVFGHLHNIAPGEVLDRNMDGVRYIFASCDYLDFKPKQILEI